MNSEARLMSDVLDSVVDLYLRILKTSPEQKIQQHVPQWVGILKYNSDRLTAGRAMSEPEVDKCLMCLEAFMQVSKSPKLSYDSIYGHYRRMLLKANQQ